MVEKLPEGNILQRAPPKTTLWLPDARLGGGEVRLERGVRGGRRDPGIEPGVPECGQLN